MSDFDSIFKDFEQNCKLYDTTEGSFLLFYRGNSILENDINTRKKLIAKHDNLEQVLECAYNNNCFNIIKWICNYNNSTLARDYDLLQKTIIDNKYILIDIYNRAHGDNNFLVIEYLDNAFQVYEYIENIKLHEKWHKQKLDEIYKAFYDFTWNKTTTNFIGLSQSTIKKCILNYKNYFSTLPPSSVIALLYTAAANNNKEMTYIMCNELPIIKEDVLHYYNSRSGINLFNDGDALDYYFKKFDGVLSDKHKTDLRAQLNDVYTNKYNITELEDIFFQLNIKNNLTKKSVPHQENKKPI